MSNVVFPVLPGLTWPFVKQPMFQTKVQRAVSGKEYRAAFMQYPLWTYTLYFNFLRDLVSLPELQELMGFFNARQGSFDNFLFNDPDDYTVTDQLFGVGTAGGQTVFPLVRTLGAGGFTANDLVQNVHAMVNVKDNGSTIPPTSGSPHYTIDSVGNITFSAAPTSGHTLTWSGTFYYRCRFLQDVQDFGKIMMNPAGGGIWDLNGTSSNAYLQFIGSPQNKV